jgi:hypothetical protein
MDRENIVELIKEIKGPNAVIEHRGDWVSTNCPLAPWTHATGSDSSPSFGIHVAEGEASIFNCFTCHSKGTLPYLVHLLEDFSGEDFGGLQRELENGEILGPELPEWEGRSRFRKRKKVEQLPPPIDKELLALYDPAEGHPYLAERGIHDCTSEELGLLVDPDDGHGVERILFPVHAPNGDFYGFSGRAVEGGIEPKVRDYFGLNKRLLLLGANHIRPTVDKYVVVVEGLVDHSIVFQRAHPVVATMHSSLTPAQAKMLLGFGLPVIVFYDNDLAGKEGTSFIAEVLQGLTLVLGVTYPDRKIRMGHRLVREVNDPGELTDDEIDSMITNAIIL